MKRMERMEQRMEPHNSGYASGGEGQQIFDKQAPQSVFLPESEGSTRKYLKLFNWKMLVAVVLVLALIGSAIGLAVGLKKSKKDSSAPPQSQYPANVMRLCNLTRFPDVCNAALSSLHGADKASDTQLVSMALGNARDLLQNVYGLSVSLNASSNATIAQAAVDCMDLLGDGIESMNDTMQIVEKLTAGQFNQIDNSSVPELHHFLSQVTTVNTDCAEVLFGLSTYANASGAPTNLDAAFKLSETVQMLLDNSAALVNRLPELSQLVADWQAEQNKSEVASSAFNIMEGVFDNVTPQTDDAVAPSPEGASGGVRRLQQMAVESDGEMPEWARRQLLGGDFARRPDATVAARRGTFRTVQAALNNVCAMKLDRRGVIFVAPGTYREKVAVPKKCRILIYGTAGQTAATVITWSDSVGGGGGSTFATATFTAKVDHFVMAYLTIKNEAGPENHQAVALRLAGKFQAVYMCIIDGYQDTLYAHNGISYIRECSIAGTVDFIFGNQAAFFQSCALQAKASSSSKTFDTITAQGRTSSSQPTGFVFNNCKVQAGSGLNRLLSRPQSYRIYMGRPWKAYSRVVFANTYFPAFVNSKHFVEWTGGEDKLPSTVFYGEYKNYGPGYRTTNAISGVRFLRDADMRQFAVGSFVQGRTWIPQTAVPYN